MRSSTIAVLVLLGLDASAQSLPLKNGRGGIISAGARSSFSFFNDGDARSAGNGIGGQFRLQLSDRVNTDWFYDYLTSPIGDFAHRQDQHIGWSVLFYLREPGETRQFIQPYVLAGHCFDYSKLTANGDPANYAERWSSAVQAGLGTHFNLTDRMDISVVGQYMAHLGNHVHAEEHEGDVEFHQEPGAGLEGHLLVHVSFNYKLIDAW
jgi:opacity protein-like surface antigen